ncbi:putative membrane protein YkoI [Acidovorax delafieldii]|uniref:Membrane protein YkoI n=1 Tax=Acidovorax delafieldii TaxID=47920 RepID=A0AAJ2C257_ACIDE|nr:plasmid replication/partition related protein [Acidovorax delafieldii]MDR6768715.1 putative membrane protein YkoI [Acidovorax delafieldii]MDR6837431.1 putative membrane protein YkoI [Acidovorax delafieldii]MDR7366921.1 putative membrane protein YkoI [Acidovorax delafieldii]
MNIVVNEELKAYIEPLTPDEHDALERSILTEGCRDALVLWGDVLVDGHNRYGICQKHGLPFQTVQNPRFQSMEDVHLWMIDQHLGRRSVSDFQRGVLALRKREIMAERKARSATATDTAEATPTADVPEAAAALPAPDPLNSREAIAKAARLSSSQVVMIEKIQKQAAPELVAAVKSGTISINAAAAVATLPAEEQVAAAVAGKDELKQAAKRVRELNKRKPREEAPSDDKAHAETAAGAEGNTDELHALRQRVAELTAENTELRRQVAQLQAALPSDSTPF